MHRVASALFVFCKPMIQVGLRRVNDEVCHSFPFQHYGKITLLDCTLVEDPNSDIFYFDEESEYLRSLTCYVSAQFVDLSTLFVSRFCVVCLVSGHLDQTVSILFQTGSFDFPVSGVCQFNTSINFSFIPVK